jgi:hypothetical protein
MVCSSDDLTAFRWRLAETIAWCAGRACVADPQNSLRTPALRPPHLLKTPTELDAPPVKMVSLQEWAAYQRERERTHTEERARQELIAERLKYGQIAAERQVIVRSMAEARARLLRLAGKYPSAPAEDLAGGRLLVLEPECTVWDGVSGIESEGFFDGKDLPPWDTWLCCQNDAAIYDTNTIQRMKADQPWWEPPSYESYLVSWVPPELIELADRGIYINPVDCIFWATDCRTFLNTAFMRALQDAGLLD